MSAYVNIDYRSDTCTQAILVPAWHQGECGSCWAVASVACIEASFAKQIGEGLPPLSVQHVLDACTTRRGYPYCQECDGGQVDQAVRFVEVEGLIKAADHPYHGRKQEWERWKYFTKKRFFPVLQLVDVWSKCEPCSLDTVHQALGLLGPLIMVFTIGNKQKFKVVVGSVPPIWQGPSAPDNPADESSFEDHAVLIVGISSGSTSCQEPHFIVQNSWGAAKPNEGVFVVPVTELPHFRLVAEVKCSPNYPGMRIQLRALLWRAFA